MNKHKQVLDHGYVKLLNIQSPYSDVREAELIDAARVARATSFANDKDRPRELDEKLTRYLMRERHTVPFEHIMVWLEMRMPIMVERHIVKHRTTSISEVSGRYVVLPDLVYIPEPSNIRLAATNVKQGGRMAETPEEIEITESARRSMIVASTVAYNEYQRMLSNGVAKECARGVLNQHTYITMVYRQDLHNLMHFLHLRMNEHAQWETRQYAKSIYELMVEFFGPLFEEILTTKNNGGLTLPA